MHQINKVAAIEDTYDEQVSALEMQDLLDELGCISEFIKSGEKVLIKKNMRYR